RFGCYGPRFSPCFLLPALLLSHYIHDDFLMRWTHDRNGNDRFLYRTRRCNGDPGIPGCFRFDPKSLLPILNVLVQECAHINRFGECVMALELGKSLAPKTVRTLSCGRIVDIVLIVQSLSPTFSAA